MNKKRMFEYKLLYLKMYTKKQHTYMYKIKSNIIITIGSSAITCEVVGGSRCDRL